MPSYSPKMARTMAGAAHDPAFAKKVGIPQGVAKDFNQADKGTQQLKDAMRERSARHQATESMAEKQMEKRMGRP